MKSVWADVFGKGFREESAVKNRQGLKGKGLRAARDRNELGNRSKDTGPCGVQVADITGTHSGLEWQDLCPFVLDTNHLLPQTCKFESPRQAMNLCPITRTVSINSKFRKRTLPSGRGRADWKFAKLVLYTSSRTQLLKTKALHVVKSTGHFCPTLLEGKKEKTKKSEV